MKVRVTLTAEYEYEGDETTNAAIIQAETEAWQNGDVGMAEMVANDDKYTLKVDLIEENADAE